MRNLWIFITTALLGVAWTLSVTGGAERVPAMEPGGPVEREGMFAVMTWNIHHGVDERGRPSLERIAAAIRAVGPDVVFLAEVDENWRRSGFVHQAEALAAMTGMKAYYFEPAFATRSPIFTRPGEVGRYGNAFLTRLPILDKGAYPLPTSPGVEPRNLLYIDVRVASEPVRIFGTHLSVEAAERKRQLAHVQQLVAGHQGAALLVGDFNTTPGRLQEVAPFLTGPDWQDVHAPEDGPGETFPASRPSARIDYIFANAPMRARLQQTAVIPTDASDHLAVVARFLFP